MRIVHRVVGALLISCLGAAPVGVSAEGYVCASGARMVYDSSPAACSRCHPVAQTPAQAAFEQPCCTYVGSTSLPPVLTVSQPGVPAAHRALLTTPGVTAIAGPVILLGALPQYDSGGSGSSPPHLSLQRTPQLRN